MRRRPPGSPLFPYRPLFRSAQVGFGRRVAGFGGRFDRAAAGSACVAAQPLVGEAGGSSGPFAGVSAQRPADLGAAADRRRADVLQALELPAEAAVSMARMTAVPPLLSIAPPPSLPA